MAIDALILSRDPDVINVFRNVMEDSGIHIEESTAAGDSMKKLARHRYDAVVVDCEAVPDGADVIEALRKGKSNRSSITFAVIGQHSHDARKAVSLQGATFVLHKPISTDTVLQSMKASHGLILRERRRYLRHSVETHAHIKVQESSEMQVTVTDISEGGCAITIPFRDNLRGEGTIRLLLPEVKEMLDGKIEVMWCKPTGEAGVRFAQMSRNSQKHFMDWLNSRADIAGLARDFKMAKRKGA
jgi:response regulator RpfG family c-di-GMP phosphodiesterase